MYLSGRRSAKLFMSILLRGNEVVAVAALCSLCFVFVAYAEYLGIHSFIEDRVELWNILNASLDFGGFL